jgi:hypothetical protein
MTASIFGISGSVMSRNLVPVWVWKQVRRKKEVSRVSRPVIGRLGFGAVVVCCLEGGFSAARVVALGLLFGRLEEVEGELVGLLVGILGVRDFVMA